MSNTGYSGLCRQLEPDSVGTTMKMTIHTNPVIPPQRKLSHCCLPLVEANWERDGCTSVPLQRRKPVDRGEQMSEKAVPKYYRAAKGGLRTCCFSKSWPRRNLASLPLMRQRTDLSVAVDENWVG